MRDITSNHADLRNIIHNLSGCAGLFIAVETQLNELQPDVREIYSEAVKRLRNSVAEMRKLARTNNDK